tara:strand:+ start:97 stop:918 length:822 start_codon:yes stop_codon:yes gene_type:complete
MMTFRPLLAAAAAAAFAIAVVPVSTPVMAQSDPFQAGLRGGWQMQNGNQMAAVYLQLADGWKTYWRAPGDSGIPPDFDWEGSRNVQQVRFHWPRPYVYETAGLRSVGYKHELVLPLEVTPVDPSLPIYLKARVDLGVCSDICIPASFSFAETLPEPGAADDRISRALRQRPSSAKEAGLRRIACEIAPGEDGLRVTAVMDLPSTGGDEAVVIEPGDRSVWVSEAAVSREGRQLTATVEMAATDGQTLVLQRQEMVITVLGSRRAVEIRGCPTG